MKEVDEKESLQRYEATQSTSAPDSLETWSSQMPPLPPVSELPELEASSASSFRVPSGSAEEAIGAFTRDFVRGRKLQVLAISGHAVDCLVALDKQLRYLVLQRLKKGAKRRALALESVEQVGDSDRRDLRWMMVVTDLFIY